MLRNYPSGEPDFSTVRDLQHDRLVMWQHRYYLALALIMNFGLPLLIGWAERRHHRRLAAGRRAAARGQPSSDVLHQFPGTHFGIQPYTDENTARDNAIVALLTFGEGYHNFHHMFAHDYRNGVRWWQWDPSKWLISALSWFGLARNLKTVPWFRIQRAMPMRSSGAPNGSWPIGPGVRNTNS